MTTGSKRTASRSLPVGTVTLLLADVEGSTQLWDTRPADMRDAMSRLDAAVDGATIPRGGVRPVEQGEGDSFVVAFARASDAVAAAIALQRADLGPLRLRIGVHTGEVQFSGDTRYSGPALNRCARLRDLAHGGQVLLSRVTQDVVVDLLPEDTWLADLGEMPLRGLGRPEQVFQLCHPDLGSTFPPLRSALLAPSTLPVQLTSFVGREREVAEVCTLLGERRMVTLTGTGGCGKTRLAVEVARRLVDAYPGGVHWVDLSALTDPALVPSEVATALQVREAPARELTDTIARHIGDRELLLIVDNCEHLAGASAELADRLLRACPALTVMTTSREPVGTSGEVAWHVSSLTLPPPEHASAAAALASESVQLFVDRAQRSRPRFTLDDGNAAAVSAICRRLDGIPLAIELAAARVRSLTPQQVADGLLDRFRLLTGGPRTAVARQRTLEASVEWSHALLSDREQSLLRRLSVFAGSFLLEAAERVCTGGGIAEVEVLDVLTQLVDRSLVQAEDTSGEERYRLLETIRDFARHKLTDSGEADSVRESHFAHYLGVVERAEPELESAALLSTAERLELDHDNLRAAIDFGLESGDADRTLTMTASLHVFWVVKNHPREGVACMDRALDLQGGSPAVRATALAEFTWLTAQASAERWVARSDEAIAVAREAGELRAIGRALTQRGYLATTTDPQHAWPLLEEALAVSEQAGDRWCECTTLTNIGVLCTFTGRAREARNALGRARELARTMGDPLSLTRSLIHSAECERAFGDLGTAAGFADEAVQLARQTDVSFWVAFTLIRSAAVTLSRGDHESARAALYAALDLAREHCNAGVVAMTNGHLALAAYASAELDEAESRARESLDGLAVVPMPVGIALVSVGLALCSEARHDHGTARAHAEEALTVARRAGLPDCVSMALQTLARIARAEGDTDRAEQLAHEALQVAAPCGLKLQVVTALEVLAGLAAAAESYAEAARLFAAAAAERDRIGFQRPVIERDAYDAEVAVVRGALAEAFAATWQEGAALSLEKAVAYATRGRGERKRPSRGWASLTPAEIDVARLVAEGLSNKEIGNRLFLSPRTVQTHLAHSFDKLDITSRVQLATVAAGRL